MQNALTFLQALTLLAAITALATAAMIDARTKRIPNILSALIFLLFPVFALASPTPVPWLEHFLAFALVLSGGVVLYARHWLGAGDVKLLAALALWAGKRYIPHLLLLTVLAGGLLCLLSAGVALLRHRKEEGLWGAAVSAMKQKVSYGVAIATGGLCVFLMLSHQGFIPV